MKIAISSEGNNLESNVDSRFGRCTYFIIADIENNELKGFEVMENKNAEQMGGAGISSGEAVAKKGVNAVITGNVGPRAFEVFKQFNIDVYIADGKISKIIEKFIKGELEKINSSKCPDECKK